MCLLPHSGHKHSTFDLSKLTTASNSPSGFSIGFSCFLEAFRLSDDIFENPAKDEITINETGDPKLNEIARVLQLQVQEAVGF